MPVETSVVCVVCVWWWGTGGVRGKQLLWGVGEGLTGDTRRTAKHTLLSPGLTAAVSQGTRWNNEVTFSQHRSYTLGAEQVP